MPTLTSIGVHPQLRETLAKLEPPIETPQALISRNPDYLAQSIGVPLNHILAVRSAVADALISKEGHGQRALHVKATLKHCPVATTDETGGNDEHPTDNTRPAENGENDEGTADCATPQEAQSSRDSAPTSLIMGSVTALDLCLYESLRGDHGRRLPTGSRRLDALLSFPKEFTNAAISHPRKKQRTSMHNPEEGGIPFGYVTQVTGPPASGKTQLALMVAATHASKQSGISVHYLASGVGQGAVHSLAKRFYYLCRHTKHPKQALQGVSFTTVTNGYEVLAALSEIESRQLHCTPQNNNGGHLTLSSPAILVVLDSASGCLSGDLYSAGDGGAGVSLAREVELTLKRMARQYGIAVLVTNGTVSGDGNSIKAAMGQSWQAADLKLWLTILNNSDWTTKPDIPGLSVSSRKTVRATLQQHPAKACHCNKNVEDRTADFVITGAGIADTP